RLLPRRLGQTAPALATADVDGDGRTDLFVRGARGQAGALYLAAADGAFTRATGQPWPDAAAADDTGALFFDANADGHTDLYVSAGGVEPDEEGNPLLNDRLYLGDGKGGFKTAPAGFLPADGVSSAAVAAGDFDGDGRTDL